MKANQNKHKHKKEFGQNFLREQIYLDKIMENSMPKVDETVLEIGPGDGALTELMLEKSKEVICVEIDNDLEKLLTNKFKDKSNFKLIMKDILKVDFKDEIGKKVRVIANIPYYITSPIINKLIENREYVDEIYIMVQKEVAERVTSKPGKSSCSILTMAVKYFADSEYLFTIPKDAFEPAPKVDSAFMKIIPRKDNIYEKLVSEELYFKYVKAGYASKRKNILNNFSALGYEKAYLKELLGSINIDSNLRAEDLSIDDFVKIIELLEKNRIE